MPLLRGTDGEQKMSKSYDNYVGLSMDPAEMFGRTMSIPDTLLLEWIGLASGAEVRERSSRAQLAETDPLSAKRWLAETIVKRYHGADAARRARDGFDRVHREGDLPDQMPCVRLSADEDGGIWIAHALKRAGLAKSTSEARRILEQGGIRVDGEPIVDPNCHLSIGTYVVQRGRRTFVRLDIEEC
jgi:tyrosyl-tRNA synthetase